MNIVFEHIEINNFLSLGQEIRVDLQDQGFTLVQGINQSTNPPQSNGSGKSSIFDAIFWTITGETLRGTSDVVNEQSSEGCSCSLFFYSDNTLYSIKRTKGGSLGSTCSVYQEDELLSDQVKKSQEMIYQLIPSMSSEILGSIVLLGQGLPYKFSSLTPSKRKDLLEMLSGSSSQIDKLSYQLSVESSQYVSEFENLKNKVLTTSAEITSTENLINSLSSQSKLSQEDINSINQDIENYSNEIKSNIEFINDSRNLINELNLKKSKFVEARESVQKFISDKSFEIRQLEIEITAMKQKNCPTCGRPFEINIADLSSKTETYKDMCKMKSSLDAKLAGINSQISKVEDQINTLNNQSVSFSHQNELLQIKIEESRKTLKVSEDFTSKISSLEKEKIDKSIFVNSSKDKLDDLSQYLDVIDYLKRQLSRDFKGYMLQEVIDFVSSRCKHYSNFLFTDQSVAVELSGNKVLIKLNERLYENLSGGERQRVDLSVQFALRDMLTMTTGLSCNILVLDEAFDSLDIQGSESLINLILSEFYDIDSVFVVTHHTDISVPYDRTITVTKNSDSISEVECS